MGDKYRSFLELAKHEADGADYRVRTLVRPGSAALLIAPHGGAIEPGTSELAELIAGEEHNLFCFEGLKSPASDLHITSHRFDHPMLLEMLLRCSVAVAIHGCKGQREIYLGGRDLALRGLLASRLSKHGIAVTEDEHRFPGKHPENICNRTWRGCGAQLELTSEWRAPQSRATIARAVAEGLDEHLRRLAREPGS